MIIGLNEALYQKELMIHIQKIGDLNMILKLDLTEEQEELVKKYIDNKDINFEEIARKSILEAIEDYEDVQKALEILEDPNIEYISFDEVLKRSGLSRDEL